MSHTILSAIVRASIAMNRDPLSHGPLSGVCVHRHGTDLIRAVATDGRFMVVAHAWAAGWNLTDPVIINADGVARVTDLYRRTRKHLDTWSMKHDPTKASPPFVTGTMVPSSRDARVSALEIGVPRADETCRCPLINSTFPAYQSVEMRGKEWKHGMGSFGAFNFKYLALAAKLFPKGQPNAFHSERGQIFRANDWHDYVLIMPINIPKCGETFIPFEEPQQAQKSEVAPVAEAPAQAEMVPA